MTTAKSYLHNGFILEKPLEPAIFEHPGLSHHIKEEYTTAGGSDLQESQRPRPAQVDPFGINSNVRLPLQLLDCCLASRHSLHRLKGRHGLGSLGLVTLPNSGTNNNGNTWRA